MSGRLSDKVAIITGAARGIGKVAAKLFAEEGAKVVIADIDAAGGLQTAEEIQAAGGQAFFQHTDLTDAVQVERLIQMAVEKFGRLDILYNNAALNHFAQIVDTEEEDWDRVMTVNVKSVFLTCKYAIPVMKAGGGGAIINTGSAAALVGLRNLAVYTASKGAVLQLTRNMALDYAKDGIRVNALCPGVTATEMTEQVIEPTRTRWQHASVLTALSRVGRWPRRSRLPAWRFSWPRMRLHISLVRPSRRMAAIRQNKRSDDLMKVVVLGAGGWGALVGAYLSKAGADVTLLFRRQAHVDEINKNGGLIIQSPDGDMLVPVMATTQPGEISEADLLIVAVKNHDTEVALQSVSHMKVGAVASVQNGLGHGERFQKVFPESEVLRIVSRVAGSLINYGKVMLRWQ